jgi:hypothetical protein
MSISPQAQRLRATVRGELRRLGIAADLHVQTSTLKRRRDYRTERAWGDAFAFVYTKTPSDARRLIAALHALGVDAAPIGPDSPIIHAPGKYPAAF